MKSCVVGRPKAVIRISKSNVEQSQLLLNAIEMLTEAMQQCTDALREQ